MIKSIEGSRLADKDAILAMQLFIYILVGALSNRTIMGNFPVTDSDINLLSYLHSNH